MATITVTTTAQQLPARVSDIQNLSGSVDVYFDFDNSVSSTTGMKLGPGLNYPVPFRNGFPVRLWVCTASGTADLRHIG
jgi:hypothetical protein